LLETNGAVESSVAITNAIVVSHAVGIEVPLKSSATVNGILWYGNNSNFTGSGETAVTGQITGDPAFAADGHHLTAGSAAIDKGIASGVPDDIDGQIRPTGNGPDLGADEFAPPTGTKAFIPASPTDYRASW
jgi:hypothetical protein